MLPETPMHATANVASSQRMAGRGIGISFTPTHTAVNVAATSTSVIAANTNRVGLLLVNDSDTVIYIKLGAAAVANQGIRINANGSSFEMNAELGNLCNSAVYGIHASTGNKVLLVTEYT
jgi:hypothetical protein